MRFPAFFSALRCALFGPESRSRWTTGARSAVAVLALVAGPLRAQTEPALTPDERLQAIRLGLVQAALQGATQVQAGAWIDGQGALREASSFRSGMQVRGVRVLSYQRDANGLPQAQLQMSPSQDLVKNPAASISATAASAAHAPGVAGAPAPACTTGEGNVRLRHLLGLRVELARGWPVDDAALVGDLAQGLLSQWLQASQASTGWRMLEQGPPQAGSAYDRVLTGSGHELLVPWKASVSISPVITNGLYGAVAMIPSALAWVGLQPPRATPVRLQLTVQAPGQKATFMQTHAELVLQAEPQRLGPYRLTAASQAALRNLVQGWARTLSARLACEPLHPEVLHVQGQNLQINVGALAGVQTGDEWLLADRQRFPGQLLEPGVTSQTVLARVQQVSALQASLQVVAGPASSVQARWQAWPAESPASP